MKLNQQQFKELVKRILVEELSKYSSSNSNKTIFMLDEMSVRTLIEDSEYKGIISEASSYNWILKQSSWEVNNYKRFLDIIKSTPSDKKGFLTWHGMDEITKDDWVVYTLKNYDVAFALHYIDPGKIDICNLVNNSQLKGIGKYVLQFAKQQGGTQLDNYRGVDKEGNDNPGKLGNLYRSQGFDRQTWRDKFNPEFQPPDKEWQFDTDKYGEPDVEGLELSKHRMKYNQHFNPYKDKFNQKTDRLFKK